MITVRVDVRKELAKFKAAGPEGRKEMTEFMRRHGRALISSSGKTPGIVQLTPPHSQGKKGTSARKQGEDAVRVDIWRVYGTLESMFPLIKARDTTAANEFWKFVKMGKRAKAEKLAQKVLGKMMGPFDGGNEHKNRRGRKGRVTMKQPSYFVRGSSSPIKKYIRDKQKRVGLLASALIQSAEARLGGKLANVPAWIRRHVGKIGGDAQTTLIDDGKTITVRAVVTSSRAPAEMQRRMDYAAGYRLNAMKADLPRTAKRMEQRLQSALAS